MARVADLIFGEKTEGLPDDEKSEPNYYLQFATAPKEVTLDQFQRSVSSGRMLFRKKELKKNLHGHNRL